MRVVSNTSPISNLAIIDRLDLLERRYKQVLIPIEVARELQALSHSAALVRVRSALDRGWLRLESPECNSPVVLPFSLDAGESAAISLAVRCEADLLLIDERRGRTAARALNLTVGGLLGELLHAKIKGWIPALYPEIARLRNDARFFVDSEIEKFFLAAAAEQVKERL